MKWYNFTIESADYKSNMKKCSASERMRGRIANEVTLHSLRWALFQIYREKCGHFWTKFYWNANQFRPFTHTRLDYIISWNKRHGSPPLTGTCCFHRVRRWVNKLKSNLKFSIQFFISLANSWGRSSGNYFQSYWRCTEWYLSGRFTFPHSMVPISDHLWYSFAAT